MDKQQLLNLRKFLVPEIVYGDGALKLAGRHAVNFGATKVLIVTDPGVEKVGWTRKVELSLRDWNLPYCIYNGVTPNPRDHEVMAGAELCLQQQCDLIIAIGGGSPMDCAKGIGVVTSNHGHITDFEGVDEIPNPGPPLIFIPTTAGTSADVSQFAIITDTARNVKITIISKMVVPEIALVDPETTITMPPELTAATGMDALCHAFEAFVSTASSPLTDMAAITAIKGVMNNLMGAYNEPENMLFRDNMMMASLMAGLAFSNASLGLVHAIAHSLGGSKDLAHGECNAILLEKVIQYNYSSSPDKYDSLINALDIQDAYPGRNADEISEKIMTLREKLGITYRLKEMGVTQADLTQLAQNAINDPCCATNPRTPVLNDVINILTDIYE